MITHLEPDILEWEVKWASESITTNKASGGDGIPVELFQILKDDAVKVLHSICQQVWKTQPVATGLEKVSFPSNPKERQCQRMLKFSWVQLLSRVWLLVTPWTAAHQAPLSMGFSRQEYWSGLPLPLTVWITINWKILQGDGNTKPPDLPHEKSVFWSRSNN